GTNGSGAVVQSATSVNDGSGTYAVNLNAFGNSGNATFFTCAQNSSDGITAKTGYVTLADRAPGTPAGRHQSNYTLANDTTPNATGLSHPYLAVALEIAVATAAPLWANKLYRPTKLRSRLAS